MVNSKELNEVCFFEVKRDSIDVNVIRIKDSIAGNHILAYLDTEVTPLGVCPKGKLEKNYRPNTIRINTDPIRLKKSLADIQFTMFMPHRITHVQISDFQFIVLEGQAFYWTSSSNMMRIPQDMYIMAMLSEEGRLLRYLDHAYYNKLSKLGLLQQLNRLFFEENKNEQ